MSASTGDPAKGGAVSEATGVNDMFTAPENIVPRRSLFIRRADGMYVLNSNFRSAINVVVGQDSMLAGKDPAITGPASCTHAAIASAGSR